MLVFVPSVAQKTTKATDMLRQRGEIYVKLNLAKKADISYWGRKLSIDKVHPLAGKNIVYAYLNTSQVEWLEKQKKDFELLTPPSMLKAAAMCADQTSVNGWDCYPTYSQYVALMEAFATDYPEICKLEEFGESIEGRKLLVLKISDNVNSKEEEPEFFYTSSMHGDETTGYVLSLRLINYLLANFGTDARVTELVNNTEIWINPLSNPDGTYSSGNNDITGATRANSNGVDLNRNFPDPAVGEHPDGYQWQPENIAMMDFMKEHNFVLSANFHGGTEVVNYPWDTWELSERTHADHLWYQELSHEYADTVHINSTGYMTDFDNGITHGATWYAVAGGRQDYVNYYLHGREVTIEISNAKTPDAAFLPSLWNYNYRSMLNYINRVHLGIYGKVTDQNGAPVHAKITLVGHDADSSEVYSDAITGMYYRMVSAGSYTVEASAYNHGSVEHDVTSNSDSQVEQNFVLERYQTGMGDISSFVNVVRYQNPIWNSLNINLELVKATNYQVDLFDVSGKIIKSKHFEGSVGENQVELNVADIVPGIYFCKIHSKLGSEELKIIKLNR